MQGTIKETLIKAARSFYRAYTRFIVLLPCLPCWIGRCEAASSKYECFSRYGQLRAIIKETQI